jgi:N utilization substance protein A
MAIDLSEAILQLKQDRNMSEELIQRTIEDTLKSAYKKRFGNIDNVDIRWVDNTEVSMHARKKVVDGVYDPSSEIELEEARAINPDAEEGDEFVIEIDPREEFDRIAIRSAKQTAHQSLRDIQKDSLFEEFKDKIGKIIIGYYQRERDGTIYVDLGKLEGVFPKEYQSPREDFHVNDRIKAMVVDVAKTKLGLKVVLSRSTPEFVRAIFELEVPEIYDKTVEIHKIVREPGYRTKLAVYSNRDGVDPVGACVGLKGARIQSVIKELEGEKIDILKYDIDPVNFIKNALSPAEVKKVILTDEVKHQALAIVSAPQLSLAIGKKGLNVKLANRLVDWSIDVKTAEQYGVMDANSESRKAVSKLFDSDTEFEEEPANEISHISELPGVDAYVVSVLFQNDIDFIEDFLNTSESVLSKLAITAEQLKTLQSLIEEYVEIIEEDDDYDKQEEEEYEEIEEEEEPEIYRCPECGAEITVDMTICPQCGIGFSFEYEE